MELVVYLAFIVIVLVIVVNENKKKAKYKNGLMSDEEKEKYEKKLAHREQVRKEKYEKRLAYQEQLKKSKTIKQVMIVGNNTDSRKKVGSTVIRGAVGGALLGPVGLVGGALSGKNKVSGKTTFLIEYEDGHRETKEVDSNSIEFKKLCNYLKMD